MRKLLRILLVTVLLLIGFVLAQSALRQIPDTILIINSDYSPGYVAGSVVAPLLYLFIGTTLFIYGIKVLRSKDKKNEKKDHSILDEEMLNEE